MAISPRAVIDNNCNISQGVIIGYSGRGHNSGVPIIGDGVYIGLGAKIFGKIKIGSFVGIGANAVVNKSLDDHSVLVRIPARSISNKGSKELIKNQFKVEQIVKEL